MENASKALIIAGAILVSILIIGLGMTLYNNAAGTLEKANIDETAVRQYNAGFTEYEGQTNVKGANVKALIRDVMTHNRSNSDDETLLIEVVEGTTAGDTHPEGNATVVNSRCQNVLDTIRNGGTYEVHCGYDTRTGFVVQISVSQTN